MNNREERAADYLEAVYPFLDRDRIIFSVGGGISLLIPKKCIATNITFAKRLMGLIEDYEEGLMHLEDKNDIKCSI